jgi:hypothetical protein
MTYIKIPKNYECITCDYRSCNKKDYEKHILTRKHQILTENTQKTPIELLCICGNKYKHRQSLNNHKKKCNGEQNKPTMPDTNIDPNSIMQIIQQNDEFKSLLIEQNKIIIDQNSKVMDFYKNGVNTTNNVQTINNNNSNNKSFNLNVFLNETCKDAMNMKDFVDSIQITLTDIENMGKLGFVNGISNIIVNRLKAIDVHLRPVHCTDQRRETMYVKEKNQWNKEEEDNKNIRRFIQLVAHKNTKNLSLFKNKHPDCLEYHSKYNDQYNKIVMETFGGYGNTDYDSENKIIRKLVKELAIDKSS